MKKKKKKSITSHDIFVFKNLTINNVYQFRLVSNFCVNCKIFTDLCIVYVLKRCKGIIIVCFPNK
jgi:hypothetical protein